MRTVMVLAVTIVCGAVSAQHRWVPVLSNSGGCPQASQAKAYDDDAMLLPLYVGVVPTFESNSSGTDYSEVPLFMPANEPSPRGSSNDLYKDVSGYLSGETAHLVYCFQIGHSVPVYESIVIDAKVTTLQNNIDSLAGTVRDQKQELAADLADEVRTIVDENIDDSVFENLVAEMSALVETEVQRRVALELKSLHEDPAKYPEFIELLAARLKALEAEQD